MLSVLNEFRLEVIEVEGRSAMLFTIEVQPTLVTRVVEAQKGDEESEVYRVRMLSEHGLDRWTISDVGGLRFQSRLFVPSSV